MKTSQSFFPLMLVFTLNLGFVAFPAHGQEALAKEEKTKEPDRQQQAFLSSGPVVLPNISPVISTANPLDPAHPVTMPSLEDQPALPVQSTVVVSEQLQTPIASGQEQVEQIVQQKIEKPIQPPALPESPVISSEPVTIPLPGREITSQPPAETIKPEIVTSLEPVIVTATKTPLPTNQVPGAYSVMTGEYLQKHQIRYVEQALRQMPGNSVAQSGGPGRVTNLYIRGTNADQSVILLDGVKVNSPTTGEFSFADLTTDQIEQIEIIRGPQSVLYGSMAMGGVVNIITKKGEIGKPRYSTKLEYGSKNTWQQSLSASGGAGNKDYLLSIGSDQTNGVSQNDDHNNLNLVGRLGWNYSDVTRLETSYRFNSAKINIDDGAFVSDPNDYSKSRQHVFKTSAVTWLSDHWESKLTGSFFHDRLLSVYHANPDGAVELDTNKIVADAYSLEWQQNYQLTENQLASGGYQFEYTNADKKSFDQTIQSHGIYLQDQIVWQDRWFLTGGVRWDHHRTFGASVNPRVALTRDWAPMGLKLKGTFGTAFHAPDFNDLFYRDSYGNNGNPHLKPEESTGYDFGIEKKWSDRIRSDVTYFHNRFKNLIEWRLDSNWKSSPTNVSSAKTEGVEAVLDLKFSDKVSISNFYTFLQAQNLSDGSQLLRRPKHSGGVSLDYAPWGKIGIHLKTNYVGRRADFGPNLDKDGWPIRTKHGSYLKMDLVTSYEYLPSKKLYARVENLTNRHYDDVMGFESNGTMFTMGSDVQF
jgi:vitamin B12 transporter